MKVTSNYRLNMLRKVWGKFFNMYSPHSYSELS